MTVAILVLVILTVLYNMSAAAVQRHIQEQIAALRAEVRAMHESQIALHQQLERRLF